MAFKAMTIVGKKEVETMLRNTERAAKNIVTKGPGTLSDKLARFMYLEAPSWSGHLKQNIFSVRMGPNGAKVETRTATPHRGLFGDMVSKPYAGVVEAGTIPRVSISKNGNLIYWPQYRSSKFGGFVTRALNRLKKEYGKVLITPIDTAMR
jgi:hypothetical protein